METNIHYAKFQFLEVVILEIYILLRGLISSYQQSGGVYCLHHQGLAVLDIM